MRVSDDSRLFIAPCGILQKALDEDAPHFSNVMFINVCFKKYRNNVPNKPINGPEQGYTDRQIWGPTGPT